MKKIGTAILPSLLHRLNIFSTENKYVSFSNVFVKIIFFNNKSKGLFMHLIQK